MKLRKPILTIGVSYEKEHKLFRADFNLKSPAGKLIQKHNEIPINKKKAFKKAVYDVIRAMQEKHGSFKIKVRVNDALVPKTKSVK